MNVDNVQGSGNQVGENNSNRAMGKEDFLKLLTTQLTHQDPLNPMDNTQFVAQLAQFSSLEQMIETNKRLEMLAMSQSSLTSASAVGFIGRDIEAWSDSVEVQDGVPNRATLELSSDAANVTVEIRNADGDVVRTLDMGPRPAGQVQIEWDGLDSKGKTVPDGTYLLKVKAEDTDGKDVNSKIRIKGHVSGVTFEKGYAELVMGELKISMADVIEMH
ncbi:MAG: flagellar hook assembly protein FlgD [Deltaproteobacteria bacterium]|nr:flagellar hook assembly protein FlgD [Deltaproteobacteria bacterium]